MNWPFFPLSPVAEMHAPGADAAIDRSVVRVAIHEQPFEPWQQLEEWLDGAAASAVFLGRVRPEDQQGGPLDALELVHYPGLCEQRIQADAERLCRQHGAHRVLVLHRVGRLVPGALIVLVAVTADRRGPAQRCCSAVLEALKHDAPFWKREWRGEEGIWLSANTPL